MQQQLSLFPELAANDAPTITDVVSAVPRVAPANDVAPGRVDPERLRRLVILAVQERRVCRLAYVSEEGVEVERDVEVYAITRVGDHWSVFGYCRLRGDLRTFRSDRVARISVTDDCYTPRKGLSLERFILRRKSQVA